MSLLNPDFPPRKPPARRITKQSLHHIDFCKIGGLNKNLQTLREIIIFPLLHGNVFSHFNIKAPRGVLFYGPPGTGKTLVAAALATEINKEGLGKVSFFSRKGADILDKWLGASEKNLRELFEKATKNRPSIIFFDEIDGLAPARDKNQEQVHASVVASLLSLMDGLDSKPGVIVIGATNRIETLDSALRRPGRFDKELYFPLPGVEARRQILEVHTGSWKYRPAPELLSALVEVTAGFSGADLQALCADAILRSMKRLYPCLKRVKIDPEQIKVEECDFMDARSCQVPSAQRSGNHMRKLTPIIQPLLGGQLRKIIKSIDTFWAHFLQEDFKYMIGEERYAGRLLLIGNTTQGVDTHLIPALLQRLEYLPVFIYDVTKVNQKDAIANAHKHHPSVTLLSRIDEWWNIINECEQLSIVSTLEDIHAGLPVLVIATCRGEVPDMLKNFFYNNSSIMLSIEDPTDEERKAFLKPLFFDRTLTSFIFVLQHCRNNEPNNKGKRESHGGRRGRKFENKAKKRRADTQSPLNNRKRPKRNSAKKNLKRAKSISSLYDIKKEMKPKYFNGSKVLSSKTSFSAINENSNGQVPHFSKNLHDLFSQGIAYQTYNGSLKYQLNTKKGFYNDDDGLNLVNASSSSITTTNDVQMQQIYDLWRHASLVTSKNMAVAQLELLYDVISACINIHWSSFESLVKNSEDILRNIEQSYNEDF
ncbi:unnamed protein product [Ceutorhynchus assimilis]|uniref:AAA+ ATPase domain-containing protein n=1 Tax=Ceutorhynchus assimilis TaxID=467358 RepID=A0A9N9QEX4_9CUCU|nr:unnamed protein product [Ceutorhynchus assimilis]